MLLDQPRPSFLKASSKPLIYITGGRLGSEIINSTLAQVLPQLLKKYQIIHQCGPSTKKRNYTKELSRLVSQLPKSQMQNYYVRDWIEVADLAWIYRHAKCVVTRAGANTILELKQTATPCILIPLPFAFGNEQLKNAKNLAKNGGCLVLEQRLLGPEKLVDAIEEMVSHHHLYRQKLLDDLSQTKLA
ncbi:MAG: hypothetical protein COU66_01580, partial [Candidatus Pacebacteria bacterium CG10_big_fil_rev_8_21_14_0_10_44_11]